MAASFGFITGVLITLMNLVNAQLSGFFGNPFATALIHLGGLLIISVVCLVRLERIRIPKVPLWVWSAGLVGILTILFSNAAFSNLDMTLATAAVLAGQVAFGMIFDAIGFMGSRKIPIGKRQLSSLALILLGTAAMAIWR